VRKSRLHANTFTESKRRSLAREYKSGSTTTKIAREHGVSASFVKGCLSEFKVPTRPRTSRGHKLDSTAKAALIRDYRGGMTCQQVANRYGVKKCSAWELLNRRGLTRPRSVTNYRYTLNAAAFDDPTGEAAYWLGFLMADGCLDYRYRGYSLTLQLSSKDVAQIESLQAFLGAQHPIRIYSPPKYAKSYNSGQAARLMLRIPEQMANALISHGITPQKSLTAVTSMRLAADADFWRGCIDGDGTVYFHKRRKYPAPVVVLHNASPKLIDQFSSFVRSKCPGARAVPFKGKGALLVNVGGRYAIALLKLLYGNHRPSLARKAEVAAEILAYAAAHPNWCTRRINRKIM
jgi:transposase